jgi:hypothetical protein
MLRYKETQLVGLDTSSGDMGSLPTNQKHHLDLAFLRVVFFVALVELHALANATKRPI